METLELETSAQPSQTNNLTKTDVYFYVSIFCFLTIIVGFGPSLLYKFHHNVWCIPASECVPNDCNILQMNPKYIWDVFEVNMHAFGGYLWSFFLVIQIFMIYSKSPTIHRMLGKSIMPLLFAITFVFAIRPTFSSFGRTLHV